MIELLSRQSFVYAPSTSEARSIKLNSDGKVEDFEIKNWKLLTSGMPTIVFTDAKGEFISRSQWDNFAFSGMDRGGHIELRPSRPEDIRNGLSVNREVRLHGKVTEEPRKERIVTNYNLAESILREDDQDTAVAIVACNRPGYFERTLKSLAPQIQEMPTYVFLDIQEDLIKDSQLKCEALVKQHLPKAKIIKREVNWGCGLNIFDARDQLFTNFGYENVYVFEDDMVVSSNYIEYCNKLLEYSRQFTNVGAVQGWSRNFNKKTKKRMQNKEIHVTFDNLWGYVMTRECWNTIRSDFIEYTGFLAHTFYGNRDNMRISRWQSRYKQVNFIPRGENPFPQDNLSAIAEVQAMDSLPTGQDGVTYSLMRYCGFVRLASTVNRGMYIGKSGIHSTPDLFLKSQLDKITLDEFSVPDQFVARKAKDVVARI